jgi:hypothetical protein
MYKTAGHKGNVKPVGELWFRQRQGGITWEQKDLDIVPRIRKSLLVILVHDKPSQYAKQRTDLADLRGLIGIVLYARL